MEYFRFESVIFIIGIFVSSVIPRTQAVDGFEQWSRWSSCNAECGTGISTRSRSCIQSSSRNECHAETQYRACNRQKCTTGQGDLKQIQCSSHDGEAIGSRSYTWQPYVLDAESCVLTCSALGYGFYKTFSTMKNGTICGKDDNHVCVNNKCRKIGCDNIIGSKVKIDSCGVCGGDDSTCLKMDKRFTKARLDYGYNKIGTIPAGARNINITQLGRSRNYLALRESGGEYFVNGNRRLSHDGKIDGTGTIFHYHRRRLRRCPGECIISKGPTNVDLDIMLLAFSHNPGIAYQYSLPNEVNTNNPEDATSGSGNDDLSKYEAIIIEDDFNVGHTTLRPTKETTDDSSEEDDNDLSNNGNSINHVVQTSYNVTIDSEGKTQISRSVIKQNYLYPQRTNNRDVQNPQRKPQTSRRLPQRVPPSVSGTRAMPGYTQSFSFIDRMLNKKKSALRENGVTMQGNQSPQGTVYKIQSDKVRPTSHSPRNGAVSASDNEVPLSDDYNWVITGHTPCNKPCNTGTKQPFVECYFKRRRVADSHCSNIVKPSLDPVPCNEQPCNRSMWKPSEWSPCSVTCGRGLQSRSIMCVHEISHSVYVKADDKDCEGLSKPNTSQVCQINTCNQWRADDWSQCSVTCGMGRKTRRVYCITNGGRRIRSEYCDVISRPMHEATCHMGLCGRSTSVYVSMRAWFYTEWPEECPVQCGSGKQTRKVLCLGEDINTDPSKSCTAESKPETQRECVSRHRCQPEWFTGNWNDCNATCGNGFRLRDVICVRRSGTYGHTVIPDYQCRQDRPLSEERCDLPQCSAEWYTSEWGECSVTCGRGRKSRKLMCIDGNGLTSTQCQQSGKPRDEEECHNALCRYNVKNDRPGTYTNGLHVNQFYRTGVTGEENVSLPRSRSRRKDNYNTSYHRKRFNDRTLTSGRPHGRRQTVTDRTLTSGRPHGRRQTVTDRTLTSGRPHGRRQTVAGRTLASGRQHNSRQVVADRRLPSGQHHGRQQTDIARRTSGHRRTTQRTSIPRSQNCRDQYQRCQTIVDQNLCGHAYYGKLCCATCNKRTR